MSFCFDLQTDKGTSDFACDSHLCRYNDTSRTDAILSDILATASNAELTCSHSLTMLRENLCQAKNPHCRPSGVRRTPDGLSLTSLRWEKLAIRWNQSTLVHPSRPHRSKGETAGVQTEPCYGMAHANR